VLAHGFTLNAAGWGPLLDELAEHHRVVAVDLPGHGGSSTVVADLRSAARLLGEVGGHADYLGYSLGGRVVLHLALARPDLVRRLVLIGATAGIEDGQARAERRRADEAFADGLDAAALDRPEGEALEAFVDTWLSGPLFASLDRAAAEVDARLRNTASGLAASLRLCGTGRQEPLWDRLSELAMPVLVVAGERDARFAEIGRRMVDAVGSGATLAIVPGAGHACHLEAPSATARIVGGFLGPASAPGGPPA